MGFVRRHTLHFVGTWLSVVSRFDGAHSTGRMVVVVLVIRCEEIHFILAWCELFGTMVFHRYDVVTPKVSLCCRQAFHWYSSFLVLHLRFEGLSGHVRLIGRILLGVFGEKTWFLCLLINLGGGMWAMMLATGAKVADAPSVYECHSPDITSHHISGHEPLQGPPTGLVGRSFKRLGRKRFLLERKQAACWHSSLAPFPSQSLPCASKNHTLRERLPSRCAAPGGAASAAARTKQLSG